MDIHRMLVSDFGKSGRQYNRRIRVIVYSPQLIENYTLQSGEGLSVLFVVIWLLGDIANLLGGLLGGLLPTVIILAFYVSPRPLAYRVHSNVSFSTSSTLHATLLFCSKFTITAGKDRVVQLVQGIERPIPF